MKTRIVKILLLAAVVFSGTALADGITIGGTRLIYSAEDNEADIAVKNTNASDPALIQSWVDDVGDNKKSPFIVTPPLFRLDANTENTLRVIQTSGSLPQDRESLFTLNIKVIPASHSKPGENVLQFAIKNELKLIYRPAGLPGSVLDAAKQLSWHQHGNTLRADNSSPYYVTITEFTVDGQLVRTPLAASVLAPHGSQTYTLPARTPSGQIQWRVLNDFGASQDFSATVVAQ
ncbi:TPA: molecular chaperone [Citrobacter freundii]